MIILKTSLRKPHHVKLVLKFWRERANEFGGMAPKMWRAVKALSSNLSPSFLDVVMLFQGIRL